MSFWQDTWEQLQSETEKAWDVFLDTGAPAIQASLERQAIAWLEKQNIETQKKVDEGIARLSEQPDSPFGAALKETAMQTFLNNYGLHLGAGVLILIFLGVYLGSRK